MIENMPDARHPEGTFSRLTSPMVPSTQDPTVFNPGGTEEVPQTVPTPERSVGGHESEYRELVKLNSFVVKTVLDMLLVNPVVRPMLGPDFETEAASVSNRIAELLNTIHPNPDQGIDGS